MSVTVDHERLEVEQLGLRTVGQVLCHLQRDNRLVVNLLIDGEEPDLDRLGDVKQAPVNGHTVYIETAEPREMALEVLAEVEAQLNEADRLKGEAVDLLQRSGGAVKAMERLSGCFTTWHHAQESVDKTAQLLRLDLELVRVGEQSLAAMMTDFGAQLRQIKDALESRDFVTLGDILSYEMTQTSAQWRGALAAVRDVVCAQQL
jgi:hypothetical protein